MLYIDFSGYYGQDLVWGLWRLINFLAEVFFLSLHFFLELKNSNAYLHFNSDDNRVQIGAERFVQYQSGKCQGAQPGTKREIFKYFFSKLDDTLN